MVLITHNNDVRMNPILQTMPTAGEHVSARRTVFQEKGWRHKEMHRAFNFDMFTG
jgi:hypothetical protein